MYSRFSHVCKSFSAMVLVATLLVMTPVATPPAAAICTPNADRMIFTSPDNVRRAVEQTQYPSTCDGDKRYYGELQDSITDGSCVWAVYLDGGQYSTDVVACTTGVFKHYTHWDQNNNTVSFVQLCWNGGCSPQISNHSY